VPFSYVTLLRGDDEISHAFFPTDALASTRWSRRTGRPAVFSYMGIPSRETASWLRGRMRILERAMGSAAVVGLSRTACDALWRWWGVEARLIYPGVDLSTFEGASAERSEEPAIACGASPDDERKRVPLLVEAFRLVRREHPRARLLLMRPRDRALEQRLGGDGIELYDPSPVAVADVFAQSWVSALTSREEAFGLVVVESLATGTPVVAADEAGPAEILDREGIGTLFDDPEPAAVARALLEAIELSRDSATAARCRQRARDFTSERCAIEHELLYQELLSR
jgi:glycosyltransferase involved in cell wall biosynthesis